MASRRTSKKKSTRRSVRKVSTQTGKLSRRLLFSIGILLLVGIGVLLWQPWKNLNLPFVTHPLTITKPRPNLSLARQMTVDPSKDTIMQIVDSEKVYITLEIPKGALKEKTVVKMIPFYYDSKAKSPTAGVIISPATITFFQPATLAFNFSESKFRNTSAPKNLKTLSLRSTGSAQVMEIDKDATSLTPMLIARAVETESYLPARILTGGAYVFSLDGVHQEDLAKRAFSGKKQNSLIIMESASSLVFNGRKLADTELVAAKSALKKILTKKNPPAVELYAAISLQKELKKQTSSILIRKAYADTNPGYFEFMCKQEGKSVTEYLTLAQTAELLGYQDISEKCKVAAKNIVAEEASKVLENPDSDVKSVLIALQRVQLIGLDEDSNLDEALLNRAKVIVTKEAQRVLADENATAVEVAKALQKVGAVGAANDSVEPALAARLEEYIDKEEAKNTPPENYEEDHEDLIPGFDMNVVGLAMAQALFGLESFDENGIEHFADQMAERARKGGEFGQAICELAAELGIELPPECANIKEMAEGAAREIEREGYRGADEVDSVQDREYEIEEYGEEEEGDEELDEASWMFYDFLTGTPAPEDVADDQYDNYPEEDSSQWDYLESEDPEE